MNTVPATLDLAQILKGIPAGAWVALSNDNDKVIAFGADMQSVLSDAKKAGENTPLIVKVPDRQETLFL